MAYRFESAGYSYKYAVDALEHSILMHTPLG